MSCPYIQSICLHFSWYNESVTFLAWDVSKKTCIFFIKINKWLRLQDGNRFFSENLKQAVFEVFDTALLFN